MRRRDDRERHRPLETSITTSEEWWRDKDIHYRMHPANAPCLTAARIDCCALANNHVLDWGYPGLKETLAALRSLGIATAGLGEDQEAARRPAVLEVGNKGRVVVLAFGEANSGVPPDQSRRCAPPPLTLRPFG